MRPHVGGAAVGLLCLALSAMPASAQRTTAERTNNRETSAYADVVAFVDSLQRRGAGLRVRVMGRSTLQRNMPLVIAARPMVFSPSEAHRSGKPIIYLQANIHAGEVEGKEAVQMLLRDLTLGALQPLLDSVIVLAVPIYNIDGNERLAAGDRNRPGQNGPAIVGQRSNGMLLDLNRDYVKAEAPETRAALALLDAWDPDVFVDLHTTNGSYHGYQLTYAPGLNPNPSQVNDWTREQFLPELRERMRSRHKRETFWYGNFRNQDPDSLQLGWETYDARPRFGTNWAGLRHRVSVLSEAYSNAEFGTRIDATYDFVRELLSLAVEARGTIKSLIIASQFSRPDSVIVRSALAAPTLQPVIAELSRADGEGSGGSARRKRSGEFRTIRMPVFDRFMAVRKEARPAAYFLAPQHDAIAALLQRQGVAVTRLSRPWSGTAESFGLDSVSASAQAFEGHRTVTVQGHWRSASAVELPAGSFLVSTDQPLGLFASYLLEPASEDGVVTWNMLDRELRPRGDYPIRRVRERPIVVGTELE